MRLSEAKACVARGTPLRLAAGVTAVLDLVQGVDDGRPSCCRRWLHALVTESTGCLCGASEDILSDDIFHRFTEHLRVELRLRRGSPHSYGRLQRGQCAVAIADFCLLHDGFVDVLPLVRSQGTSYRRGVRLTVAAPAPRCCSRERGHG